MSLLTPGYIAVLVMRSFVKSRSPESNRVIQILSAIICGFLGRILVRRIPRVTRCRMTS
jgi:hypothetical protein